LRRRRVLPPIDHRFKGYFCWNPTIYFRKIEKKYIYKSFIVEGVRAARVTLDPSSLRLLSLPLCSPILAGGGGGKNPTPF
jgi:hypothetical protein